MLSRHLLLECLSLYLFVTLTRVVPTFVTRMFVTFLFVTLTRVVPTFVTRMFVTFLFVTLTRVVPTFVARMFATFFCLSLLRFSSLDCPSEVCYLNVLFMIFDDRKHF